MDNPICFALDVPTGTKASEFVNKLEEHVGAFKVGLELFIASGAIPATERPIVLDLKLHDIPETVERAVKAGGDQGIKFMTLHIQQRATLERAVKAAEQYKMTLLGVTVLTSMTDGDLIDLGMRGEWVGTRANLMAEFGYECGLRGFVCSPQEIRGMRTCHPSDSFFLVPGVRPAGSDMGDQKRTGTPAQAIKDGANLIVIGRPIRDAADPVQAAKDILKEISESPR